MEKKVQVLDFIKINPAGNVTILIDNFDILDKNIPKISEEIMKETNLYAEQVGFIKDNHLQMMQVELLQVFWLLEIKIFLKRKIIV